jgi:hypothetical protein
MLSRSYAKIRQIVTHSGVDRAVAQADSRRLPNTATRVRALVKSYGIYGGQGGTGAGSLRVPRFPLLIHSFR